MLNLLALLLLGLAAYLGWWAAAFEAPWWWVATAAAAVTSFGLFRRRTWAQIAWHAIALIVSLSWLASVLRVALSGWPYTDVSSNLISLVPGLLLVAVCAAGSLVVRRHYRSKAHAA